MKLDQLRSRCRPHLWYQPNPGGVPDLVLLAGSTC